MKPWPALWPPTLATKSQKPRPERWPLTDPSLPLCAALPTQPASGQRLVASLCSQQTAVSSLPTSCLPSKQIARASHPFPARDCPRAKLWSNRRSCALKRRTYLQLLALKSLQPWPQLWPIAQSCYSRRPLAGLKQTRRACVAPKRAQLWVQASAATFTRQTLLRLSSLQLQRSASASEEIAAAFA